MEAHIKNLFKHGVNEYNRKERKLGDNTLGMSVFRQAYSRRDKSYFGIELADKFEKLIIELNRPEIITYSRIAEDDKGQPVQIKRANSANIGYAHEEQGLILLFPNGDDARDAEQRLIEAYPGLLNGDEPMIMSGEHLEELIDGDVLDQFLQMENLRNTTELGHRVIPTLEELVFINAPPSLPGKGLYWVKAQDNVRRPSTKVEQEAELTPGEDVKF